MATPNVSQDDINQIADWIRKGFTSGFDPYFVLNTEVFLDEEDAGKTVELGDSDYEHISNMVREGYLSGELNVSVYDEDSDDFDEFRGWWSIDY